LARVGRVGLAESFVPPVDTPPTRGYPRGVWGLARTATPTGATRCQPPDRNDGGFLMAQQKVNIRYPDGMITDRIFPADCRVLVEPEGEWVHVAVFRPGGFAENLLKEVVPSPDVRLFSASIYHGDILTTLIEDEPDA